MPPEKIAALFSEKIRNRHDRNACCSGRVVQEGAEMADVAGQQMRGPAFDGRQKDRPVFFGKVNGTSGTGNRGYDPRLAEDGFQAGQACGEFNVQIAARLFDRKGRCQGLPMPLRPEFHNERSLPRWIMGRREEYIGIQEDYWGHISIY